MNEIILYVKYDGESAVPIINALKEAKYEVIEVDSDIEAVKYAENHEIDMLLLDEGEKRINYKVIHQIRRIGMFFVVMILSNSKKTEDIVGGFTAGANDYISKPVQLPIVLVRIHNLFNLLSIERNERERPIRVADLMIDPKSRRVERNDQDIYLTPKEYELLLYLAQRVNQVCSREEILKEVWKYDYSLGTNVVDVYVRHLRIKIDKGYRQKLIQTARGVGYILEEPK